MAVIAGLSLLLTTTVSTAAGASESGSANGVAAKGFTALPPGSVWVLTDGAVCEADSFTTHHRFAATDASGDQGTFKRESQRPYRLTMTWTQGPAAGDVFLGRYIAKNGQFEGSYTRSGHGYGASLQLASASTRACAIVSAAPRSASIVVNNPVADTATVTGAGGVAPTGDVSFAVCPAADAPCQAGAGTTESLGDITLAGSGEVGTTTSLPFTPSGLGSYCFSAFYSGDHTYASVLEDSSPQQCFTATRFEGPAVDTNPASASLALGESNTDTATVSGIVGGPAPTGTVTFYECGPLWVYDICTTLATSPDPNTTPVGSPVPLVANSANTAVATSVAFTAPSVGEYCFEAVYSGDGTYPAGPENADACFSVSRFRPVIAAAPADSSIVLGGSDTDSATVTGVDGVDPTGYVDFTVCPGDTDPCTFQSPGAQNTGNLPVADTGPGDIATVTGTPFVPTMAGVYCFSATYSIDPNYATVTDGSLSHQCFTVTPATPIITSAPADASVTLGSGTTDRATVTGLAQFPGTIPTGTVHFIACPGDTDPCTAGSSGESDVGTVALSNSGSSAAATATSPAFQPTALGTYCFAAIYSGDNNFTVASDGSTGECFTVNPVRTPVGLVALNKVSPHEILAGGTGQFVVSGDIFLNTAVTHQPWSGSFVDPTSNVAWTWDDAIDAKTNSNIYVYGTIQSNNGTFDGDSLWPLDTCFEPNILGEGNPVAPTPTYQSGDPGNGNLPGVTMSCAEHGGASTIDYDNINPTNNQIDDPLSFPGAPPPNPLNPATDIACPGSTLQTNPAMTVDESGVTQLSPGEYTTPVEITGSANFNDCPGGATGIYRFDQGLWINPQASVDTVTGSNVVIGTENPYPVAGNVPGSIVNGSFVASGAGNGAPCLPSTTMTSVASGNGTPIKETTSTVCGGTDPATNGVVAYGDSTFAADPTETGTGDNFSLMVGGVAGSTLTLTGPTSGVYGGTNGNPGLVLYQDPGTQANFGLDAESGDAADISLNGVVYDASLSNYGADAPLDYWDGSGGGIPFFAGGTLQAGFGAGWSDGPAQSAGSVSVNGTTVVDDYNTDGATSMTIIGQPYELPGTSSGMLAGVNHSEKSSAKASHRKKRRHR